MRYFLVILLFPILLFGCSSDDSEDNNIKSSDIIGEWVCNEKESGNYFYFMDDTEGYISTYTDGFIQKGKYFSYTIKGNRLTAYYKDYVGGFAAEIYFKDNSLYLSNNKYNKLK